jgi:pilus assembly protein Flp/PilA
MRDSWLCVSLSMIGVKQQAIPRLLAGCGKSRSCSDPAPYSAMNILRRTPACNKNIRCSTLAKLYCGEFSRPEFFRTLLVDSRGVTAIEYALIAALIAVAAIAAFTLVGTNLSTTFSSIASQL